MKALLLILFAGAAATPALAQHAGHNPPEPPPATGATTAAADPHATQRAAQTAPTPPTAGATDPHAGHVMPIPAPSTPQSTQNSHAGHDAGPEPTLPAAASADPHAGHAMLTETVSSNPHAGHAMGAAGGTFAPPVAATPAQALSGPANAADAVFGASAMNAARAAMNEEHGGLETSKVLVDQLELSVRDGDDGYAWDAQAWYGGDIHKLWLKTEGEGVLGDGLERAEVQALWSRAIDPWFDLQLGVRQDFGHGPDRTHLVAGVQGLAPYWFEVDAALFLSDLGDLTARAEVEYDLRLTQRLILQPRIEAEASLQDIPELEIGSGLSTAEFGARLRYEIRPEFAPYVGVQYERAFGGTADFRRQAGEEASGWSVLLGIRTWF